MPVRLFVGNHRTRYGIRSACVAFSAVAPPTHIAVPVDRETGRPRGFAFVDAQSSRRAGSHQAISRSAVPGPAVVGQRSAGARTRRAATGRVRTASAGGRVLVDRVREAAGSAATPWRLRPRLDPSGLPGAPGGGRRREFGPDAKPKKQFQKEKPKGPIRERGGGRHYSIGDLVDDGQDAATADFDDFATSPKEEPKDDE